MIPWSAGKSEYTEAEAASTLGISVEQLRALVREHVTRGEPDLEVPVPPLRLTDLLLLKMLAERGATA
jgi:hypothetical protein